MINHNENDDENENTLSKCPAGHPVLHRGLKLNSKIVMGQYNCHRGRLIFHQEAKQKLYLKNAEIPDNMLLLLPKSKMHGKHLTI